MNAVLLVVTTLRSIYTLCSVVCVRMWGRRELLLQVAIDFEAVVARIGHHDVSVRGERQPLWAVQRVCRCVDVRQERAAAIKHLRGRNVTFS